MLLDWMLHNLLTTALIGFGLDGLLVAGLCWHASRHVTRVWTGAGWGKWTTWEKADSGIRASSEQGQPWIDKEEEVA